MTKFDSPSRRNTPAWFSTYYLGYRNIFAQSKCVKFDTGLLAHNPKDILGQSLHEKKAS